VDGILMLALPPAPVPARPRLLVIGTALVAGAVFVVLVSLISVYLDLRHEAGGTSALWLPKRVSPSIMIGNIMFFGMLGASVMVQWAVDAVKRGSRRDAGVALGLAAAVALMVLNAQVFEYGQLKMAVASSNYATMYYTITGTFLAAVIGGLVLVGVTLFRTLGGRYSPKDVEGLVATAVYWHVLTAAFFLIWFVVYLFK
jgi:heme/copper-type cytochrome/quinol oxidase subunit 3